MDNIIENWEGLCIGNLILDHTGKIIEIHSVSVEGVNGYYDDSIGGYNWEYGGTFDTGQLKYLPLTEETLLEFGAKEVPAKSGVLKEFVLKSIRIEMSNSGIFYYKNSSKPVLFVHTLQNLCYCLKGINIYRGL